MQSQADSIQLRRASEDWEDIAALRLQYIVQYTHACNCYSMRGSFCSARMYPKEATRRGPYPISVLFHVPLLAIAAQQGFTFQRQFVFSIRIKKLFLPSEVRKLLTVWWCYPHCGKVPFLVPKFQIHFVLSKPKESSFDSLKKSINFFIELFSFIRSNILNEFFNFKFLK